MTESEDFNKLLADQFNRFENDPEAARTVLDPTIDLVRDAEAKLHYLINSTTAIRKNPLIREASKRAGQDPDSLEPWEIPSAEIWKELSSYTNAWPDDVLKLFFSASYAPSDDPVKLSRHIHVLLLALEWLRETLTDTSHFPALAALKLTVVATTLSRFITEKLNAARSRISRSRSHQTRTEGSRKKQKLIFDILDENPKWHKKGVSDIIRLLEKKLCRGPKEQKVADERQIRRYIKKFLEKRMT